jgi:hypothetical protein
MVIANRGVFESRIYFSLQRLHQAIVDLILQNRATLNCIANQTSTCRVVFLARLPKRSQSYCGITPDFVLIDPLYSGNYGRNRHFVIRKPFPPPVA